MLKQLTRFRETLNQFIIKDQVKRYTGLEGSFSVNVFTNLETFQVPSFRGFVEVPLYRHY